MGTSDPLAIRVRQLTDENAELRGALESLLPDAPPDLAGRPTPPDYAGPRTKTWNPSLHLYNGESPTLRAIRGLVASGRNGANVYIACAGDSKTAGTGTNRKAGTDAYPAQLTDILGAREGMIYAERGSAGDSRWSNRTNFVTVTDNQRLYMQTPGGVESTVTLTLDKPCTGIEFYVYRGWPDQPTFTVSVDGSTAKTYTAASGAGFKKVSITGLSNTGHTFTFTTTVAMSLLGARPTHAGSGLTISNAGRSGSGGNDWAGIAWPDNSYEVYRMHAGSDSPKPDGVILNIGTNDGSDHARIDAAVSAIVGQGIPTLLVLPGGLTSNESYTARRTRLYDLADRFDMPLLDLTDAIGDYDAAGRAGLMADPVHENARGYALEATAVARVVSV